VEPVVDPFRHQEEVRVALEDHPATADPALDHVPEQLMEQLGHATTLGGGVHMPEGVPFEMRGDGRARPTETVEMGRPGEPFQPIDRSRSEGHLSQGSLLWSCG
jgi:hypothetical protein